MPLTKLEQARNKNSAPIKQFYRKKELYEYKNLPCLTQHCHECVMEQTISNQATK